MIPFLFFYKTWLACQFLHSKFFFLIELQFNFIPNFNDISIDKWSYDVACIVVIKNSTGKKPQRLMK